MNAGDRVGLAFKIVGDSGNLDKDIYRTRLGAMVNHSSSPNLRLEKAGSKYYFYAKKALSKNDELTVDYKTFDFEGKRDFAYSKTKSKK